MKPTEIQIGDLLTFEECLNDEAYPVIQVTGILQDSFFARIDDAKADDELDYEGVVGIPLTAEILEKNGFGYIKKDDNLTHFYLGESQYCKNMELHIGTNNKGVYWINYLNNSIYKIYHVHQLQHALRLCGIEKEIFV